MKKILREIHNPAERAAMTATALGIHLNLAHESYGGTDSVRAMVDDKIIFHSSTSDTVSFLCGLHRKVNSLLALFLAENIDFQDSKACERSISETCSPKINLEIYRTWIYENESLVRELGK